jgi:uncharacterized protein DUF47
MREERRADAITRGVLVGVRSTFITPFDRGDIKDLITSMNDGIDQMQKTTIRSFSRLGGDLDVPRRWDAHALVDLQVALEFPLPTSCTAILRSLPKVLLNSQ